MTHGLNPEPRHAVVARLVAIAERWREKHPTTDRLLRQWIQSELKLRYDGGLIYENM